MTKLLILTFDLHKPRGNGDVYRRISNKLLEIGFEKSTKRKLPSNTYACKIEDIENDEGIKKIRRSYIKKVKKIIQSEHPSDATVFLMIGKSWAYTVSKI